MSGSWAPDHSRGNHQRSNRTGGRSPRAKYILALALAAVVTGTVWVILLARQPRPISTNAKGVKLLTIDRSFPLDGRYAGDPYVGPQICAECHPGEAAHQSRTGHSQTLWPVGKRALARRLDGTTVADPEFPELVWSYHYRGGELHLTRTEGARVEDCILEYAFGSGHHATTFVSVINPRPPLIIEHRLTYYAQDGSMGITPGHEARPRPPQVTAHGGVPPARAARACFACHTTDLSARSDRQIDEETMIPNVSCERCHGPGRAHVAAARRHSPDAELSLPFGPGRWKADALIALCGECHRHPAGAVLARLDADDPKLARFQPVGIARSRCYVESAGAFDCVSCHEPHSRASADRPSYEQVCRSCHTGAQTRAPGARSRAAGKPCPVAPREGCIECHMPRVDPGQHILFTDHWIRVRRAAESRPISVPPQ
jgi:Cytochrome c554 and c-prime